MVAVSTWMWPIHVMENFKNSVRTVQIWWAWKISYVKCRPLCIGMFCVTLHMHTKCQEDIWNFSGARTITLFGMGGQEDPSTPMSDKGSKKTRGWQPSSLHITLWWRHQIETVSRYWAFVRGFHRSSVDSPHKGSITPAMIYSFMSVYVPYIKNLQQNQKFIWHSTISGHCEEP